MTSTHSKVKDFFLGLNKATLHLVDEFYDENILFRDPIVELKSRRQVKDYYQHLYQHVESIGWNFFDEIQDQSRCTLTWQMTLTAKNFNGHKPVVVDGVSVITFGGREGRAVYHRDYFDMGAFVYEGLPVLGGLVRFVKRKMAGAHRDVVLARGPGGK